MEILIVRFLKENIHHRLFLPSINFCRSGKTGFEAQQAQLQAQHPCLPIPIPLNQPYYQLKKEGQLKAAPAYICGKCNVDQNCVSSICGYKGLLYIL
ncbi:unnamed protein product [Merluccius merluccius]